MKPKMELLDVSFSPFLLFLSARSARASVSKFTIVNYQPRPRPSIFIIFLIFSAFSHEKTGTR